MIKGYVVITKNRFTKEGRRLPDKVGLLVPERDNLYLTLAEGDIKAEIVRDEHTLMMMDHVHAVKVPLKILNKAFELLRAEDSLNKEAPTLSNLLQL